MTLQDITIKVGLSTINKIKGNVVSVMCVGEASGVSKGLNDTEADGYVAPQGLEASLASTMNGLCQTEDAPDATVVNAFSVRNEYNAFEIDVDMSLLETNGQSENYGDLKQYTNSTSTSVGIYDQDGNLIPQAYDGVDNVLLKTFFNDCLVKYVKDDENGRKTLVTIADESLPYLTLSNVEVLTDETGRVVLQHGTITLTIDDNGTKRENIDFNF